MNRTLLKLDTVLDLELFRIILKHPKKIPHFALQCSDIRQLFKSRGISYSETVIVSLSLLDTTLTGIILNFASVTRMDSNETLTFSGGSLLHFCFALSSVHSFIVANLLSSLLLF